MESTSFEIGEIVVLKSGGPYMTVSAIDPATQLLECIWFDEDELKHVDDFPKEVLETVIFEDEFEQENDLMKIVDEEEMVDQKAQDEHSAEEIKISK